MMMKGAREGWGEDGEEALLRFRKVLKGDRSEIRIGWHIRIGRWIVPWAPGLEIVCTSDTSLGSWLASLGERAEVAAAAGPCVCPGAKRLPTDTTANPTRLLGSLLAWLVDIPSGQPSRPFLELA